jgi:hypothetical protein
MDVEKTGKSWENMALPETGMPYSAPQEEPEIKEEYDIEHDGRRADTDHDQGDALERSKSTRSIAETFTLPQEIAFVTVICMAQFMTRASPSVPCHSSAFLKNHQ